MSKDKEVINSSNPLLTNDYALWRKDIETLIDMAKLKTAINVNMELLSLYWNIGKQILDKQEKQGWGRQVIEQLSKDLASRYPDDRGYSKRNLGYMKSFAMQYPAFPFLQVPLAQISWYHHISLLSKVKDDAERAYYITETAQNGWSRDVMLMQIDNGYIHAKGHAINNFEQTLPPPQSDLAKYIFKDPYNFSFIGTVALQNELDIEKSLTSKITDFLLEMGRGFAYIGRQYHITQPMGIAQYETEKLFADVASALPQIEELEKSLNDLQK